MADDKVIDLDSSLRLVRTPSTVAALDVLENVGFRTEVEVSTELTDTVAVAVNLLVHLEFVRIVERSVAVWTDMSHAVLATGFPFVFRQLVVAEIARITALATACTKTIWGEAFDTSTPRFAKLGSREVSRGQLTIALGARSASFAQIVGDRKDSHPPFQLRN